MAEITCPDCGHEIGVHSYSGFCLGILDCKCTKTNEEISLYHLVVEHPVFQSLEKKYTDMTAERDALKAKFDSLDQSGFAEFQRAEKAEADRDVYKAKLDLARKAINEAIYTIDRAKDYTRWDTMSENLHAALEATK